MIGKLICWITGKHKRGRRYAGVVTYTTTGNAIIYECPRCKSRWTRKAKAA